MANVHAIATGNWSNTAIWNTGSLPSSTDDVYANGFTVTIDQSVTVVSIRTQSTTGIATGGTFVLLAGRTVNANLYSGSSVCMGFSAAGTSTINGNCNGGTSHGVSITGTSAVLNVNGNCTGGTATTASGVIVAGTNCVLNLTGDATGGTVSGTQAGVYINAISATLNMTGNVYGTATSYGIYMAAAATNITINGNCTGGSGASCYGLYVNVSAAQVTVNGNTIGGAGGSAYGLMSNGANTITINGTATGGVGAIGAVNALTGTMRCTVAKGNDTSGFSGLHGSVISGVTTWERLDFGTSGAPAVTGYTKMHAASSNYIAVRKDNNTTVNVVATDQVTNGQPATSNVRSGVVFDFGNKVGTCAVPLPSQVIAGVAVDNTVGTALLTAAAIKAAVLDADVSTLTTTNSIGERLKNCATVQTTGDQLAALNP
jgi:hypothetical protein